MKSTLVNHQCSQFRNRVKLTEYFGGKKFISATYVTLQRTVASVLGVRVQDLLHHGMQGRA